MPSNTISASLEQGHLIIIRRTPVSSPENQPKLFMIWHVPHDRRIATTSNVLVTQVNWLVPYLPTERFVATGLGRGIRDAVGAENCVAIFRQAIATALHNTSKGRLYSQAYSLAGCIGLPAECFLNPSAEAVRKVLLGDECMSEICSHGFVAATHRALIYQRYLLPKSSLQEDRGQVPMQCSICLPLNVVLENERQILVALRLDSGSPGTNDEIDELRRSETELNERRLEAGYDKIQAYPEVALVVKGRGASRESHWIAKRPGRWLQEMVASGQAAEAAQSREDQPQPQPPTDTPAYHTNDNHGQQNEAVQQAPVQTSTHRLPPLRQALEEFLPRR